MARKQLKWANVMLPEAANKVAGWDATGQPVVMDPPTGGGATSARQVFAFNSSLYTEDAAIFRGVLTTMSGYASAELSAISFEVRLDASATWTALGDITALQTWVTANISGNTTSGTKFWIKVLATYNTSSSGLAQYVLHYIA